jgi:hypothetical protein
MPDWFKLKFVFNLTVEHCICKLIKAIFIY